MNGKNYIPTNILAFLQFVKNLIRYALQNYAQRDIPQQSVSELQPYVGAFEAATAVSENPETRTSAAIQRRNEARKALEKSVERKPSLRRR
jgi:hypothetical protein